MISQRHEPDLVREWLDETYEAERNPGRFLDLVIDAVPGTPQRRRRWWHRVRSVPAEPRSDSDTTVHQPRPIPATNGHTPTVIGRTQTMFSPAKAITAAALVFGIGGVLLIAQPFDPPTGSAPAAQTDAAAIEPVAFTGRLSPGDDVGETTFEELPGRVERRGTIWNPTITMSDPRLEGRVTLRSDQDAYPGADGPESFVFGTDTWRIETDDGAWEGSSQRFSVADEGPGEVVVLVGEGAYEGLYAAMGLSGADVIGVIFPAPPPPLPLAMPATTPTP